MCNVSFYHNVFPYLRPPPCLLSPGVGVVDGLLYAVGGHDGPLVRNSIEMYSPDTNSWIQLADMHSCRRNAG